MARDGYAFICSSSCVRTGTSGALSGTWNSRRSSTGPTLAVTSTETKRTFGASGYRGKSLVTTATGATHADEVIRAGADLHVVLDDLLLDLAVVLSVSATVLYCLCRMVRRNMALVSGWLVFLS